MKLEKNQVLEFIENLDFYSNGVIVASYNVGDQITLLEETDGNPYQITGSKQDYSTEVFVPEVVNWIVESKYGKTVWTSISYLLKNKILKEVLEN